MRHYLDYNATAPLLPAAAEAIKAALEIYGNPASVHHAGREAKGLRENARRQVALAVNAPTASVIFTSGGTEANHLALYGCGRERWLVSAIEHSAVLQLNPYAETIPVTERGLVDLTALATMLARDPRPAVVSVMLANNETGVIQPLADVVRLARQFGALVHTDAVQACGKIAVDFTALDVDMLSLSAHKIGGAKGVGALLVKSNITLTPWLRGGGQERNLRAGTENLLGIVSFAAAAASVPVLLRGYAAVTAVRAELEQALRSAGGEIVGAAEARLPNTTCVIMPAVDAEKQVIGFDLAGFAVSAGAACSSGKVKPSHVLRAMGYAEDKARCAIRLSLGFNTPATIVPSVVQVWQSLAALPQRVAAA